MIDREICKKQLETFKIYADKYNVTFFLVYGTCLGAIRENNFIEDDSDIDIGVYGNDKNLLLLLINLQKDFDCQLYEHKDKLMKMNIRMKWTIDLNMFHKINGKWYYLKKYEPNKDRFLAKEFEDKYFDSLWEIDFLGNKYKVPAFTKEYLEYLYGEWRIKKPAGTSNLRPLVEIK